MKRIHFIADEKAQELQNKIRVFNQNKDFQLIKFNPDEHHDVAYLLIIEPYNIGGIYYDIHPVWQNYLIFQPNGFSDTRLLVASFEEHESPNAINLMNLETSLVQAIQSPALLSPRELELPLENDSIEVRLGHFFDGHGEFSLFKKMETLKFAVDIMEKAANGNFHRNFEETVKANFSFAKADWEAFENRWVYYAQYFDQCPYFKEKDIVNHNLKQIAPFFIAETASEELFRSCGVYQKVMEIDEQLNRMENYAKRP